MFTLIDQATATGAHVAVRCDMPYRAFHCYVDGTSSPNADVSVEVSNHKDGPWVEMHAFNTLNSSSAADVYNITAPFRYVRGNVTGVSGNGEKVTLTMETNG
ncbi:MAG TPA: hypothetical protein VKA48_05065 [Gammaproteobacteria bacterium]|nr:hypothetical protein [Gammaproteobacteria bacterium]